MDTIINLILAAIIIFICITVPVFIIILRAVKKANPEKNSDMKKQSWNDVHKSIEKQSWNDVHKSIEKQSLNNNLKRTTNCRDCDGLVSKSAKQCPHCGANTPYMGVTGFSTFKIINTVVLFILFIVLMLVIFYVFSTWIISEDQRERQRLYEIFRYNQSR
jgi:uncharacterized membrane protein